MSPQVPIDPALSLSAPPPASPTPAAAPTVPLGRTRCYWAILSPNLDFVFLDPILCTHLGDENRKLLGTNLLTYVHPDEVDSLRKDLLPTSDAGGVESGGVFGSVTRCRYSRISRIRQLLGCESPPIPPDAELYTYDDEYLPLRIATSWIGGVSGAASGSANEGGAAKGAVLAFFHATEDKDPSHDNNESNRSNWTNWCGPLTKDGSYLSPERCVEPSIALSLATSVTSSHSAPSSDSGAAEDEAPPSHVFQILDHEGQVILSFPKSEGELGGKRSYQVEDYGDLAREVIKMPRGAEDATTSCTRRYRKKHPVMKGGTLTTIESVVILYGSITFACFQTGGVKYTSLPSSEFALEDVPTSERPSVLSRKRSASPDASDLPSDAKRPRTNKAPPPPTLPLPYPLVTQPPFSIATSRHFSQTLEQGSGAGDLSPTVASASAILGSFNQSPAPEAAGYSPNLPPLPSTSQPPYAPQGYPGSQPPVLPFSYPGPSPHPLSQSFGTNSLTPQQQQQLQQQRQVQQHQQQSQHDYAASSPASALSQLAHTASPQLPTLLPQPPGMESVPPPMKQKRVRVKGQEPVNKIGPKACESCGTVNSPEWRKGPGGIKSLCNACGLRYARAVTRQNKKLEAEANGEAPSPKAPKVKALKAAPAHSEPKPSPFDIPSYKPPPLIPSVQRPYSPYYSTSQQASSGYTPHSFAPNPGSSNSQFAQQEYPPFQQQQRPWFPGNAGFQQQGYSPYNNWGAQSGMGYGAGASQQGGSQQQQQQQHGGVQQQQQQQQGGHHGGQQQGGAQHGGEQQGGSQKREE